MQKEPSQFVSQVRNQIYPIIERLNDEKQSSIDTTRGKRSINKAIQYFENGLDLIERAFTKKKMLSSDVSSGSQLENSRHRQQSYRRQPQETT